MEYFLKYLLAQNTLCINNKGHNLDPFILPYENYDLNTISKAKLFGNIQILPFVDFVFYKERTESSTDQHDLLDHVRYMERNKMDMRKFHRNSKRTAYFK